MSTVLTHKTNEVSSAIDTPRLAAPLASLLDRLRSAARSSIWIESLSLICLCGAVIFWSSLLLDWLIEPPRWVRAVALGMVLLGFLWLIITKLLVRLGVSMRDADLALIVERCYPAFGDSLSTSVGLTECFWNAVDLELVGQTTREAIAVAPTVRTVRLIRIGRLIAIVTACSGGIASIAALALMQPAVADVWVRRVVLLGEESWPRSSALEIEGFRNGVRKVARGTDVDLLVKADASKIIPEIVDLRSRGSSGWQTDRMGMRGGVSDGFQVFGHVLKAVHEDLAIEVRGNDARIQNLRLQAVDAPALAELEITYTLPAYLGSGNRTASASGVVQIPRGCDVLIRCTSTKPLIGASISTTQDGKQVEVSRWDSLAEFDQEPSYIKDGIRTEFKNLDGQRSIFATFTDTDSLTNRDPITFVLSSVADEAPRVSMRPRGISTAVTTRARVPLEGTISDDHALERAVVVLAPEGRDERVVAVDRLRAAPTVVEFTEEDPEIISLEGLSLSIGDKLKISIEAFDACDLDPVPHRGVSDTWSLDVVSPESLSAMLEARELILRRRFELVVNELERAREELDSRLTAPEPDAVDLSQPTDELDSLNSDSDSDTDRSSGIVFAPSRLAESASRVAGETGEVAEAFFDIRREFDNNTLLTDELDARLGTQIAEPLRAISKNDLPALIRLCRSPAATPGSAEFAQIVVQTDQILARMRAVLDKMMELETFNEVLEILRGVVRTQEDIRSETLKRQKERAREALDRP